jgi:hypothetical protein
VNPSPVTAGEIAAGARPSEGGQSTPMTADDVNAIEGLISKGEFDVD